MINAVVRAGRPLKVGRSSIRGVAPTVVAAAMSSLFARDASGYCRTTTCNPNVENCQENESGCIRTGAALTWSSLPIVYRFHAAGSRKLDNARARAAIRRAFDAWESVECSAGRTSLRFREGPEISVDKPLGAEEAPEKFGIYFRDDEWSHETIDDSFALTNQLYGESTGQIDYADIEINTAANDFRLTDDDDPKKVDLQAVVTHEVGHYIGLAHSLDPDSIMVARYCQSSDRCLSSPDVARGLSADDRQAVCVLYRPSATEPPSAAESGCAQGGSTRHDFTTMTAGLLVLGCALVRRRFRRC